MDLDLDESARDYDEMLFGHASQLMSIRGLSPTKAALASLALMRKVFSGDPTFDAWLPKHRAAADLSPVRSKGHG